MRRYIPVIFVLVIVIVLPVSFIKKEKASKEELGKLSKGISCIRFKKIEEINLETLKIVLKLAEKKPGVAGAIIVDK